MEPKQVTVGFKVSAKLKRRIEQVARQMDLDVSSYLRSLILKKHEKISYLCDYPSELIVEEGAASIILDLVNELREGHGGVSISSTLIAALRLAKENEDRIISNKIKNYL